MTNCHAQPLSAFIGGIDQIQHIANQIAREFSVNSEGKDENNDQPPTNPSVIRSYLYELFDRITEIFDTNQFMLMTINRCIDHSKVSNNVALLASNSSFDLWSAISFPVDCIRRVQSNVTIIVNIDDCLHQKVILSDKIWFIENIFCLLSNAVKYSDESTAELRVTKVDINHPCRNLLVSCAMHKRLPASNLQPFLLVELYDCGKGIPEEQIHTLFTPFKQAQRRSGGTGLGLYSLACRMRASGGFYGVRNRQDRIGAVFWFAIPYVEDKLGDEENDYGRLENDVVERLPTAKAAAARGSTTDISPLTPITTALSILLVDDTVPIQKILRNIFARYGYRVDIAENGLKAIRALGMTATSENHEPTVAYDVILMDLQMPIMDGFEAIARIRSFENSHHLNRHCIIAMSANSDETTVNEAIHVGADQFLSKPFQMDAFNKLYHDYATRRSKEIVTMSSTVVR